MNFFIMNKKEELITTLTESVIIDSPIVEEKLNTYELLTINIQADSEEASLIEEEYSIIFKDISGWREYTIYEIEDEDGSNFQTTIRAELSSSELIDDVIEEDYSGTSTDPEVVLGKLLTGTRWSVGNVDDSIYNSSFNVNTNYMNVLEAITELSSNYSCEVRFSYQIEGNKVVKRFVDLYKQFGEDKGKRFEVDKDINTIKRTVNTENIKTAIIPYSKEIEVESDDEDAPKTTYRIDISDVVWSTANGDPVNKPKGQNWIGDPTALANWGRPNSDGTKRHRKISMEFDLKDANSIASMAWVQLGRYTQPKATYEVDAVDLFAQSNNDPLYSHESTSLGDVVVAIDRYFANPIEVQTRVVEIERHLFDSRNNKYVFGESKQILSVNTAIEKAENIGKDLETVIKDLGNVQQNLNNKNRVFRGSQTPVGALTNDIWFRPHPSVSGETQMLVYNGASWTIEADTSELQDANRLKFGTIDGAEINVINLTADNITGGDLNLANGLAIKHGNRLVMGVNASTGEIEMNISKMTINAIPVATKEDLDAIELQEGKSAYDIAKENGYAGTEAQWIESLKGQDGSNGTAGEKGADGKTSYLHIAYATSADGSTGFSTTVSSGKTFIGQYTDFVEADSGDYTKYSWSKFKGEDGYTPVKGTDYFDGKDGQDGSDGDSSFLWVRYSQNANGNPMTDSPTDAKYVGLATTNTSTAPTAYSAYKWSLVKGTDGIDGEKGANGQTSYLHIKYSNDGGTTFTANNGESVGEWIGTYVDFVQADSTLVSAYTWNKVKGSDGISPIVGFLTNESITLPASDKGVVSTFTGATGTLNVYEGTTLRNAQATYSVLPTQSPITVSITQSGVYTVSAMTSGANVLSGTATLRATYGGVTIDKILTVTKALAGSQGPIGGTGGIGPSGKDATTYWINASVNAIKKDVAGTIVPKTITFSGFSKTGTANPVAYAGRFIIQTSTDGVSYTNAYTSSANQASYTYTVPTTASFVKARYYLAGGTTVLLDEQTIPVLVDADGIQIGGRNLIIKKNALNDIVSSSVGLSKWGYLLSNSSKSISLSLNSNENYVLSFLGHNEGNPQNVKIDLSGVENLQKTLSIGTGSNKYTWNFKTPNLDGAGEKVYPFQTLDDWIRYYKNSPNLITDVNNATYGKWGYSGVQLPNMAPVKGGMFGGAFPINGNLHGSVDSPATAWAGINLSKAYMETNDATLLPKIIAIGDYFVRNAINIETWGVSFKAFPNNIEFNEASNTWVANTRFIHTRTFYHVAWALLEIYDVTKDARYSTLAGQLLDGATAYQLVATAQSNSGELPPYFAGSMYNTINRTDEGYLPDWLTFTNTNGDVVMKATKKWIKLFGNTTRTAFDLYAWADVNYTVKSIADNYMNHLLYLYKNQGLRKSDGHKLLYCFSHYEWEDTPHSSGYFVPTPMNWDFINEEFGKEQWFTGDLMFWAIIGFAEAGETTIATALLDRYYELKSPDLEGRLLFYDRYTANGTPLVEDTSKSITFTALYMQARNILDNHDYDSEALLALKHYQKTSPYLTVDGGYSWDTEHSDALIENKSLGEVIYSIFENVSRVKPPLFLTFENTIPNPVYILDIKLESGNTHTDYTPAPEDVEEQLGNKADIEVIDNLKNDLQDYAKQEDYLTGIGEVNSSLESYKSLLETIERDLKGERDENGEFVLDADGNPINMGAIKEIEDIVNRESAIVNNLGELSERWNFIGTNIIMASEGLLIGETEINAEGKEALITGIRISKNRVDFVENKVIVAEITGQRMKINRAIFVQSISVGEHKIETVSSGHTIWTWSPIV